MFVSEANIPWKMFVSRYTSYENEYHLHEGGVISIERRDCLMDVGVGKSWIELILAGKARFYLRCDAQENRYWVPRKHTYQASASGRNAKVAGILLAGAACGTRRMYWLPRCRQCMRTRTVAHAEVHS